MVSISYRSIDIFSVHQSRLQDPIILGLKKEGDEKFEAQLYAEAAAIYTIAMNYPTLPFMDTSVIAEKLFRKRAVCFYKMVRLPFNSTRHVTKLSNRIDFYLLYQLCYLYVFGITDNLCMSYHTGKIS